MFNSKQIRGFAKREICSEVVIASAWGIGELKSPDYNDSAEPWIGLYGPCRNPTQHLIDWYGDDLVIA